MIQFAPCKINLGLSIQSKRADGYHNLETVFYPIAIHDIIEIIPLSDKEGSIQFTHSGIAVPGELKENLCYKAYQLLKKEYPTISSIKLHLHKNIPMGAGLGGGSSDASTMLLLMNQLFQLGLSNEALIKLATSLGSDCPFFIYNSPCYAKGRGEILNPIKVDLSNYTIALLHPQIPISTSWAFTQLNPKIPNTTIADIIQMPIETWKDTLFNDFENPLFKLHPKLALYKTKLYEAGAIYASMSGSGSSLFGIFPRGKKIDTSIFQDPIRIDLI